MNRSFAQVTAPLLVALLLLSLVPPTAMAADTKSFIVSTPGTNPAGSPFSITITAKKANGQTDTNYAGPVTFTGPTFVTVITNPAWVNGVWTPTVAAGPAGAGRVIIVVDGTATGSSGPFTLTADVTPPVTSVFPSGVAGSNDWYRSSVTVFLSCIDYGSACGGTFYKLNGGPQTTYGPPISVTSEGATNTLEYWSRDTRTPTPNVETHRFATIKIDLTPPSVSMLTSCATPGTTGWCRSTSYTYSGTGSDALSGLSGTSCTKDAASAPCSGTVSGAGPHSVSILGTDQAGNTASATVSLAIDSVAPTVGATSTCTVAGLLGWCRGPVNSVGTASDATSGLAAGSPSCTLDAIASPCALTVTAADGSHTFAAAASDRAGNSNAASSLFKIDSTPPVGTALAHCSLAGLAGWCRGPVTVGTTASDAGSGVATQACTLDGAAVGCVGILVSGQGAHTVGLSLADAAGNTASTSVSFKIDSLAPALSAVPSCSLPGDGGWCRGSVNIAATASDAGSGLADGSPACTLDGNASACSPPEVTGEGPHSFTISAHDQAGNHATADTAFLIDSVAPAVSLDTECVLPGSSGWCRSPTFTYTGGTSDSTSGLADGYPACMVDLVAAPCAGTVAGEGPHSVDLSSRDAAGNENGITADLAIDSIAPAASVSALCSLPGNAGWCRGSVDVTPAASDDGSGLAPGSPECTSDGDPVPCEPLTVGADGGHAFLIGAFDMAGNSASDGAAFFIDATPPILATPDPIVAEATGPSGAHVGFDLPLASDEGSGAGPVACSRDSGDLFDLGDTMVDCSVEDVAGNGAAVSFLIRVVDSTPPDIEPHDPVDMEATGPSGADVAYGSPATHDLVDGDGVATCLPAPGTFLLGATLVNCSATDLAGNLAASSFLVTVADTTPPIIDAHGDELVEATSAAGAVVGYAYPATDDLVDGPGLASCLPASDSLFPLGETLVTCQATDAAGNPAAPTQFYVRVTDTTPPAIEGHEDLEVEATGPDGAVVEYTSPATHDEVGGDGTATCLPASGDLFPLGGTPVDCAASDAAGNAAEPVQFLVRVVDTTAPSIAAHDDLLVEATSGLGAYVPFDEPATTDLVDGVGTAACVPEPGSLFALGDTVVECAASDGAGNAASVTHFLVQVRDTTAPIIAPHGDESAEATGPDGAVVDYTSPATSDAVDGPGLAGCAPGSHTTFPLGDTLVTCDATDAAGNVAVPTQFLVHVSDTTGPVIAFHGDETEQATSGLGAIVEYDPPETSDAVDGAGIASCLPASGSQFPLGESTVLCDATDAAGNPAVQTHFAVHVVDTIAPIIESHEDETEEATSGFGALVTYSPPATSDAVDGPGVASCLPASGSLFPLGDTVVDCDASDVAGNHATQTQFTVHVEDTTAPVIADHGDESAEATGASGAVVEYDEPATSDAVDGPGLASCLPASGSLFALGDTIVHCNAQDEAGNDAEETTFTVHVVDTTPPTMDPHGPEGAEATGPDGAAVEFDSPATHDLVDGPGLADCLPVSGHTFALGETLVTCNASDAHGNPATPVSFLVTVVDTTPPSIDPHGAMTAEATGPGGANVLYDSPPTHDLVDGDGEATCLPASGFLFPLGTTTVTCTASDVRGNAATLVAFDVTVEDTTAPLIDPHLSILLEAETPAGIHVPYDAPMSHDAVDLDAPASCLPATGSLFPMGVTTVACDRTDAHGNAAATAYFTVTVTRRATLLTYTGSSGGQYSDGVLLRASLTHVGDGVPVGGASITFALGSQSAAATTDADGVATTSLQLNQPEGAYTVVASFAGDSLFKPASTSEAFILALEDADLGYTGETIALVGVPLALRATVFDSAAAGYAGVGPETGPGATIGDITKMWVEFDVYSFTGCGAGAPVMKKFAPVVDVGVLGDGIGTAFTSLPSPSTETSYCVIPVIVAGPAGGPNLWYDPEPDLIGALSFYLNTGQFVTGGGWVMDASGGHDNFGFNARANKAGQAQGQMAFVQRDTLGGVDVDVIVKSNSLGALRFSGAALPITATLEGKCTKKVVRRSDGEALASDSCTFSASVMDVGKGAGADTFGLKVYDKDGLLLIRLDALALRGGNVVVHNAK